MLDMCKYNMASQHDSTTQVLYLGLREPYITYTQRYGSHDPTYKSYSHTSQQRKYFVWVQTTSKIKEAWKPNYTTWSITSSGSPPGSFSLLVDVNVYIEPIRRGCSVFCKNVDYSNMSTKVLSKTYIRSYIHA